jgi:hypothetical protein
MSSKQILIDEDTVKLALEVLERVNNFNDFFDLLDPVLSDLVVDTIDAVKEALAQSRSDVKQEPKPFGYTLEETMKCWDLGYAAAVKALAKKEQPYADKAASVSNDRIKIDPVTGNVQIGTAKQEQSAEHVGEPVAYLNPDDLCADTAFRWCKIDEFTQPVYTTPQPKREPLTKDQILALWEDTYVQRGSTGIEFARAIESAHGITEE